MNTSDAELLIQRHFEETLSPYEEERLSNLILLGGAFADRFVEWRELERGLSEYFGGRKKWLRALIPAGSPQDQRPDPFRARRFPPGPREGLPEGCSGEIFLAYGRWLRSVDPGAHRDAVGRCLGLIVDELHDLLRVRYRTGLTSLEIADLFHRSAAETEALFCRIKRFLAGCIRMRLSGLAGGGLLKP